MRRSTERTIRGVGRARIRVAGTAIRMTSGRRPLVVVSSYWVAVEVGEQNMAGAAAMTPAAARKLAEAISNAADVADRAALAARGGG